MGGIKDENRIDELRQRLYERGNTLGASRKHELKDTPEAVPRSWSEPPRAAMSDVRPRSANAPESQTAAPDEADATPTETPPAVGNQPPESESTMPKKRRKKRYRLRLLLAGIGFFVLAVIVSSALLLFGHHDISGQNIDVAVTGPFTIGGGEVLSAQVGITNNNPVPIENASLVVEYPRGTKSAAPTHQDLNIERQPLDTIKAGQTVNIPLRAIVYGQENTAQQIKVSVEYHIQGSNATFVKNASPLNYKITTSPVVVTAKTLEKVSAGQQTSVDLTITSNAQTPLSNLVVKAEYPAGFSFQNADVNPAVGNDTWVIQNLDPGATKTIHITGLVTGNPNDQDVFNFTAGTPGPTNTQTLAAVLATAQASFQIENPFLAVQLGLNGDTSGTTVVSGQQSVKGSLAITNQSSNTVYDLQVATKLSGSALGNVSSNGFYDSSKQTITWDGTSDTALKSLAPGATANLQFSVGLSSQAAQNGYVHLQVNVSGHRVAQSNVEQSLMGTASSTIKIAATPTLRADLGHGNGVFSSTGPIPPKVGQTTTYTGSFMVQASTNDLSNAVVTATLPQYVTWMNNTKGTGSFNYNPVTRQVTWNAGNVAANTAATASFQVSITPSTSQINQTPNIIGTQHLSATDAFTGSSVDINHGVVTAELSTESGYPFGNGSVAQ